MSDLTSPALSSPDQHARGRHVIVGAGPVGSLTARMLADAGHAVVIVTRRGTGPEHRAITRTAADATDTARLIELTTGAAALYNCANPPYHRWATDWPPLAASLLGAAEHTGAVLVTCSNLYGYGPTSGPMSESTPLAATETKGRVRTAMWEAALAAHRAGRARVTECRASDFVGTGASADTHLGRALDLLRRGKSVGVIGDPDVPHSFTAIDDVAATLVRLGTDARAWGRAWHVPSPPAVTQREAIGRLAELLGVEAPKVRALPKVVLRTAGVFVPTLREVAKISYQFEAPFVIDDRDFRTTFGATSLSLDDALRRMIQCSDTLAPAAV